MTSEGLVVRNVKAAIEGKIVLRGVNLVVKPGEIHALMGPNGSGKSSLAYVIMGHPKYEILEGSIIVDGEDIASLPPEERAKKGVFLAFQTPPETMVKTRNLLIHISKIRGVPFSRALEAMKRVGLQQDLLDRYLNKGFSGGEMKRSEIVQLYLSSPKYPILDEPDSGMDIEGLLAIGSLVKELKQKGSGILVITHVARLFRDFSPDYVHVMIDGRIVLTGGHEIVKLVDEKGYEYIKTNYAPKEDTG
ncbi:Fe-S cluster assembly ATPase SufC [Desulfurococcaceae archaeon AG1]|jgi:Fe-S cluster assembly ATP-binding protein|nr:MAG: Fe-S cluster assembly ATPase SufC [Desulfurococcaceae archaeon]GAY25249.1 Fe-S cluster assembly ATPase SufC [Desulfurococcaceae archaeon AG1]